MFNFETNDDDMLGEGVYGKVYKIKNKKGKQYAFKRFKDDLGEASSVRELATFAILNAVGAYMTPKLRGIKLINFTGVVMQEAETDLETWLYKTPLSSREPFFGKIMDMCIRSLGELHFCDIVHGDIKPANVLIWPNMEKVGLTDFGLSTSSPDRKYDFIYTPDYRAPEVWLENAPSKASDVWAMGATLVEMVIQKRLFESYTTRKKIVENDIVSVITSKKERVGKHFDSHRTNTIFKMLEYDHEDRYKIPIPKDLTLPKRKWYFGDDETMDDIISFVWACCDYAGIKRSTFVMAVDILLRTLTKKIIRSGDWKKYAACSITLASKWGDLYSVDICDAMKWDDSFKIDVYEESLKDTEKQIMITLKGCIWIPGLEELIKEIKSSETDHYGIFKNWPLE